MNAADTYVRARIDTETKERAAEALAAMGLSISDAIRLLMLRIADEHRLPFEVKVPNATTRKAIVELESGKGKRFTSIDALMADLNADDCARISVQAGLQTHQSHTATSQGLGCPGRRRYYLIGERYAVTRQQPRSRLERRLGWLSRVSS